MRKNVKILSFLIFAFLLLMPELMASNKTTFKRDEGGYDDFFYNNSQGESVNMYYGTYTNADGEAAYCLQAGRSGPGSGTTYYEDVDFDLSSCSSSWSYDCSLACTLVMGKNSGISDAAIQMGLRLVSAHSVDEFSEERGGDGWYDDESGITNTAEIYKNTADAILSHSYDGTYASYNYYRENGGNLENVIYAQTETGQQILNEAVNLFKNSVSNGQNMCGGAGGAGGSGANGNNGVGMKVTGSQANGNNLTLNIQTTNSENAEFDIPSSLDGYKVLGSEVSCTSSGCNISLELDISSAVKSGECIFFDFSLDFSDPNSVSNMFNNVNIYNAKGGTKQKFLDADGSGDGSTGTTYNYCPDDGPCCPNTGVKTSVPSVCADEVSTGTIEDPEICAIANACGSNVKKNHDFSGLVNTAYCNLYCREEILFTFMDKTEVIAGRQFVYDVRPSYAENAKKLSTIIQGTRECAAPNINFEKWEKDYIAANKNVLSTWNNLKKWETLYIHDGSKYSMKRNCSGGGGECPITETVDGEEVTSTYTDCSCNEFWTEWHWGKGGPFPYSISNISGAETPTSASAKDGWGHCESCDCECDSKEGDPGYVEQNYKVAVNSYRRALELREKLLADIQNCNVMEKFIYEPRDQKYYVAQGEDTYTYTGYNNVYNELVSSYTFDSNVDITYEDENSELISVGKSGTSLIGVQQGWTKAENVCSSCGELNLSGGLSTKEEERLVCTGSETGANCDVVGTEVPDNLATDLKITKEQTYWQSAKFYTQIYTGKVSTSSNGQGYWIQLDDYIYPIELNKKNGVYGVWVKYTQLGSLKQFPDVDFTCAFEVINESTIYECDPLYDDYCEIECDPSNGEKCDIEDYPYAKLGFVVRSIDLNEMFPNDSRPKGMNWENSLNVIKAIQELGDTVYTTSKPQYTIHLTKENLKNIKSYNAGTNYGDFSITCNSFNCTSDFLTDLSNNSNYAKKVDLLKRVDDNMKKDSEGNWYKYGKDGVTE